MSKASTSIDAKIVVATQDARAEGACADDRWPERVVEAVGSLRARRKHDDG